MVRLGGSGGVAWNPVGASAHPKEFPDAPSPGGQAAAEKFTPAISPVASRLPGGGVHSKLYQKAATQKEARRQAAGKMDQPSFKPELTKGAERLDRQGAAHDRLFGMAKPPKKVEQSSPAREGQDSEAKPKYPPPGFRDFSSKIEQWEKERLKKITLARKEQEQKESQTLQPEIVHKRKADGVKAGARLYAQAREKQHAKVEARRRKEEEAKLRASPAITQYTTRDRTGNVYTRLYDARRQGTGSVQRSGTDVRIAALFACGDSDEDGVWCRLEWADIVKMCGGANADVSEEAFNAHCSHLGADPRIGLSIRHVEEAYKAYPERLSADHVRLCLHAERERISRRGGAAELSDAGVEWLAQGLGQLYLSTRSMPTEAEIVSAVELQKEVEGCGGGGSPSALKRSSSGSPGVQSTSSRSPNRGKKMQVPEKSPHDPTAHRSPFSRLIALLQNRLEIPTSGLEWLFTPPADIEVHSLGANVLGTPGHAVGTPGSGTALPGRRELRHPLRIGEHCEAKDAGGG
eukprot:Hpha_TRINITY_DN15231_c1_g7::TRINITY_DN15231_c1_g7_i2::g.67626::m.67626